MLACFEGRVAGDEDFRVAVLVPLYNEDPDVVVRMFSADLVHCALEAGRLQAD